MQLEVKMNDGTKYLLDMEEYDAEDIAEKLNNRDKNMVALGSGKDSIVVQRYSVTRVSPVKIEEDKERDEDEDSEDED